MSYHISYDTIVGADYKDPAIKRTLLSRQFELSPRDLFSGDTFMEMKRVHGAKFASHFASRLAARLASMLAKNPAGPGLELRSEQRNFLLTNVKQIQVFQELRFTIKDHNGKVSVRTHETYHLRRPSRTVMVRSPHGN
jgi:hypothetical protein